MKQASFLRKSKWKSFANLTSLCVLLTLSVGLGSSADDESKARIKAIRDLAKQGGSAVPQIGGYVSDPDLKVRLEAVKTIVDLDTQNSLDPLVKATGDNNAEMQIRATDGLVNFYLPGYVQSGLGSTFKKLGTSIKSKFTDTNDQIIDAYVTVRPDVIAALGKLARGGANMDSRANAARALGVLRGRAAVPDLLAAIKSNDTDVNYEALIALQKIRDKSAGPEIAFRLHDPVEKVQLAAIETTGLLENRSASNQIRDVLDRTKSAKVRRAALAALAMMPDPGMHGVFVYRLEDKDENMRVAALEGLARLRDPADAATLKKSFDDEQKAPARMAAAFGMVSHGQREMTEFAPLRYLINQLNSALYRGVSGSYLKELARDPEVRQAMYTDLQTAPPKDEKTGIVEVLGASGDRDSIPVLETLSKDPNPDVDKEALRALQNLRARVSG